MDLGVILMKGYLTFLRCPELDPYNQIQINVIPKTFFLWGVLPLCRRGYRQHILSLADRYAKCLVVCSMMAWVNSPLLSTFIIEMILHNVRDNILIEKKKIMLQSLRCSNKPMKAFSGPKSCWEHPDIRRQEHFASTTRVKPVKCRSLFLIKGNCWGN